MDSYEWDIFISYRRMDENWVNWTKVFHETLHSIVQPALNRPLKIFVDHTIENGATWPLTLARALATSRALLPVLSRNYFDSDWCKIELGLMMKRESLAGYRSLERPGGLIVPISIDDGDQFPDEVQAIQASDFHAFGSPILAKYSPLHERLGQQLLTLKDSIVNAIASPPKFDATWPKASAEEFLRIFKLKTAARLNAAPPMGGGIQ
jgi:hypothetical protein